MTDVLNQLSAAFADRVGAASPALLRIETERRPISGILWRPDAIVTSEQMLPNLPSFLLRRAGGTLEARVAGRDGGSNVAVLRLSEPLQTALPPPAPAPRVGALALVLGADETGGPTARLGMVHATGPAWHSQGGGRIDAMLRLDVRLGADEGGPVLDTDGRLLGMSTSGPRRRTLVIPTATIERVLDPLLTEGRIARGWLGVGMQPVTVPENLRDAAGGREAGLMVIGIASDSPAARVGLLPGDILLELDGAPMRRGRSLVSLLGPERVGKTASLRLLRAGTAMTVDVTIGARPGR